MRLLPHDQDTGGFFVCVLEKQASSNGYSSVPEPITDDPTSNAETAEKPVDADTEPSTSTSSLKRQASHTPPVEAMKVEKKPRQEATTMINKREKRDLGFKEDPFGFVAEDNEDVTTIV